MKLVAITSCPTGIAHTYMAAEALEKAAKKKGIDIKVETQGSVGVENELTMEEIQKAHAVIIAAGATISKERFEGKAILEVGVSEAIKDAEGLIERATKLEAKKPDLSKQVEDIKKQRSEERTGAFKHLMAGVSFMLPLVVAGGLIIALSFIFGIEAFQEEGTLAAALMQIGEGAAFGLMIPILAGYIAYSIADRPGLAPGLIGGALASQIGAGFIGGLIAGLIAGYTAEFLKKTIKLPKGLEGLKPILILPLLSSLFVGLLMIYVIGIPVKGIMDVMKAWLQGLSGTNALLLGAILGAMMAFDMGGPINKTAYTFAVGLLGANVFEPQAAVMAAGMTPPLGLALATVLYKNKFSKGEIEAGKAAWVMGLAFITEGAIPFAAADPVRVIPSIIAGSAVAGALSMVFGATLRAPHGGLFVLPIPNAVGNLGGYAVAIIVGTVVTALLTGLLKKKVNE
ncbi:PTS system D-fructose-specific IIB component (F1P-forming), Frc family /PTS system D-fructose-specific IIC component (F1P-forming), Frc family [Anaerovirgula multivorans]|uniref:PTS system D-fructose-specific IIB component (F1P-forming), Frc family /PTS system D-fructose-specific IIC component (F1P-forming), Frc family n=1 Tax=Anaerovirgula multivorans TaxID=312168 RepID=A0A239IY32_9FIRM|nr:fructose-specific PTS transporter subunit EIIC [Anaerovirgula multivorans]SNS98118.1 PTS system D-fructose-specific IIB component (F1P-forming), Frc family /PTS system D-fructose-specific IIC component (F1P-forming), Frc family [Anaerovirgula multivorans]